jgi:parvulin-like peptidyl-prolyl isomerase
MIGGHAGAVEKTTLPADSIARVNGQPIPNKLVEIFLQNDQEAVGAYPNTEEGRKKLAELREAIIAELVDRALIAQEVKKRGIAPTATQLDAAERKMIDYTGNDDRYEQFVRQNHFTRPEYREYVLKSAASGDALKKDLSKDIRVLPKEIEDYFNAHRTEPYFQWPERVTGAHILFNTQRGVLAEQIKHARAINEGAELEKALAEETEKRRNLAEEVRQQAATGGDFSSLAKKYSDDAGTRNDGGMLGTFAKGTHTLALDDAFFNLKPGETGPVVKSEFGFHVIKVLDRKLAGPRTLEESTPGIRDRLFAEAQSKKMRDWLKEARGRAKIEIRPRAKNSAESTSPTSR